MGDLWFDLRDVSEHDVFDHYMGHVMTELLYLFLYVSNQEGVTGPAVYHYYDVDRDLVQCHCHCCA